MLRARPQLARSIAMGFDMERYCYMDALHAESGLLRAQGYGARVRSRLPSEQTDVLRCGLLQLRCAFLVSDDRRNRARKRSQVLRSGDKEVVVGAITAQGRYPLCAARSANESV